jgi:hypothetical protein
MKKILVWMLLACLVTSLAWLLARPRFGVGYPIAAVEAVVQSTSASLGADIIQVRTVSAQLISKGRSLEALRIDIDRRLGRPTYGNLRSYRIVQGRAKVEVIAWSSLWETGRIQIVPEPGAEGFATTLHATLSKAFPKLRCEVDSP